MYYTHIYASTHTHTHTHTHWGGKTRHMQSGCLLLVHASHTHFGWSNGWGTTLFWEWNKETIIYTWLSLTWKPPLKTTFTFKTNLNKVTTTTKLSANCVSYVTIITSNHPYAWKIATHEMKTLFVLNLSSFITFMCKQVSNQSSQKLKILATTTSYLAWRAKSTWECNVVAKSWSQISK